MRIALHVNCIDGTRNPPYHVRPSNSTGAAELRSATTSSSKTTAECLCLVSIIVFWWRSWEFCTLKSKGKIQLLLKIWLFFFVLFNNIVWTRSSRERRPQNQHGTIILQNITVQLQNKKTDWNTVPLLLVVAIRWKDTVLSHQQQRKTLHMTTWKHTPNQWSLLLTQSFFLSPKIEECSVSSTTENIITEIRISNLLLLLFQFSPTAAASYSSSYFLVATRESSSNCAARQQQLWRRQRRRDRTRPSMESRRRRLHFIHLYRFCHLLRWHSRPPTAKVSGIMSSIL